MLEHFMEHLQDADAVVVAQEGQLDAPEGWVLESVTYCGGKRIRTFTLPKENS